MKTTYVTRRSEVEVHEINTAYVAEQTPSTYTVKCVPLCLPVRVDLPQRPQLQLLPTLPRLRPSGHRLWART